MIEYFVLGVYNVFINRFDPCHPQETIIAVNLIHVQYNEGFTAVFIHRIIIPNCKPLNCKARFPPKSIDDIISTFRYNLLGIVKLFVIMIRIRDREIL